VPGAGGGSHYFENRWKPQSWAKKSRFIFIRNSVDVQNKEPLQLDLFEPVQQGHEFKVIVTNKITGAGKVARFHEGRGLSGKDLWGVEEPGANGIRAGTPFGG
jgi:hypothetical protein